MDAIGINLSEKPAAVCFGGVEPTGRLSYRRIVSSTTAPKMTMPSTDPLPKF